MLLCVIRESRMKTIYPLNKIYNQKRLSEFKTLFGGLSIPGISILEGVYHGVFIGPGWLRLGAAPSLAFAGMRGWYGKDLNSDGTGINILHRKGFYLDRFPMQIGNRISLIDGKMGVTVTYKKDCPFPWMHVIDELRRVDDSILLGMTIVNVSVLNKLAFPFLLFRTNDI
jgi:hypothetical protein